MTIDDRRRVVSTFLNPVLPGFHPDPSVCRTPDGGFVLVTSSFEYFPGVPIFTSDDLVTWTTRGHVLDRVDQLDLTGADSSDGIWAATIRQHEGTYYVVTTLVRDRKGGDNFIVTATDPAGPWSPPILLEAEGIDPSLFFDDDGRCWFTACRDNPAAGNPAGDNPAGGNPGELWMQELDLDAMRLVGPQHSLWTGALVGAWIEGPHVYRRDGVYYLVAAEGGTERDHAVTVARASTVTGPYRGLGRNPVLTHRHLGAAFPIQNVGHADLVETDAGETWALVLGVRPQEGAHVLGREVFLVPVEWEASGPVFAPGIGHVQVEERRPSTGGAVGTGIDTLTHDVGEGTGEWDTSTWSTLRHPREASGVAVHGGRLALSLLPDGLGGTGPQAALLRRQQHHEFEARVLLEFDPDHVHDEAGIAVVQNRRAFATMTVRRTPDDDLTLVTRLHDDGVDTIEAIPLPEGPVELAVQSDGSRYEFRYRLGGSEQSLAAAPPMGIRPLSTEAAGGFTGVQLGPYATGNGHPSATTAWFTDFVYEPGVRTVLPAAEPARR